MGEKCYAAAVLYSVLSVLCIVTAHALDRGYWVVVGNLPRENIDPSAQTAIETKAAKCGFKTFNDFSAKFGFQPGFISFVLGAYATRAEARTALAGVRLCVPDAYIKQGAYLGE